ncbi:hypothetical protein TNCT_106011 [Trichonephila clavata]|uniref:Uncharacterized protein n=1 Tax=Trichonephila clavata TaxID=2740835 RepID=A0A8X6F4N9_TRICU|nr:hypothetical protein TNCT_106011 [Trichonephila clavata]
MVSGFESLLEGYGKLCRHCVKWHQEMKFITDTNLKNTALLTREANSVIPYFKKQRKFYLHATMQADASPISSSRPPLIVSSHATVASLYIVAFVLRKVSVTSDGEEIPFFYFLLA